MSVRKIRLSDGYESLRLSTNTARVLDAAKISVPELVWKARSDIAWQAYTSDQRNEGRSKLRDIKRIGATRAEEITDKIRKQGFVLVENGISRNVRRLYVAIKGDIEVLMEQYEKLENIEQDSLLDLCEFISNELPEDELAVIMTRFGLKDLQYREFDNVARELKISIRDAKCICWQALARLRRPSRLAVIEAIACNQRPTLVYRIRNFFKSLSATEDGPHETRKDISELTFEEIGLARKTSALLRQAGIKDVKKLVETKDTELAAIHKLGQQSIAEVHSALCSVYY